MNYVLFDHETLWKNLLPLTYTRPVSEIRIGILTIREKWERFLGTVCGYYCQGYLAPKFPSFNGGQACFIHSGLCPEVKLVAAIQALGSGEGLYQGETLLAFKGGLEVLNNVGTLKKAQFPEKVLLVNNVWDIFQKNGEAIHRDFELLRTGGQGAALSDTVTVIGDPALVYLSSGARAEACVLNTMAGPIYLGEDSEIMEGSLVRGPFALGAHSSLKLGTKTYGPTTIGPHCKVGGEINNSVIFGYSNKAHDGFLGNSVIAEWCNLGADTNNSNLKNNYGNVKLYNYLQRQAVDTGLQFCGLVMGDHSKSGINTMFNTGTVVGVGCNIFGGGFPPTHIPDFSWGGSEGLETYQLQKLFETAGRVFERRSLSFNAAEKSILEAVFRMSRQTA